MSEYFEKSEEKEKTGKILIPPDYSDAPDDDDADIDEEVSDEDESIVDTILEKQEKTNEKIMTSSPFGTPAASTPAWGSSSWQTPSSTPSWLSSAQKPTDPWSASRPSNGWNPTNTGPKIEIDRKKKIIFCDLLDCLTETLDGRFGSRPRDIYDFKFKFDVWQKIAAFNPEHVFIMVPQNTLPISANGLDNSGILLSYFCCCLSAFLRIPDTNCQILLQSRVGQRKEELISAAIQRIGNISLSDIIQIGIYSGYNGLSDGDKIAADACGIDYIDLYQLLNAI